ncbi:hypothetical protein [Kitasatospora cheerisanensis]|uniref:Uncharacterized protein n=1 Tax=Kitasatospora cheerisanensis KCTC 2395 TaxID=1348663 RepID=A0A066YPH6_9ACTN|nr:hypothetical protein [Kitasatospora cheerisanensis]KDN83453.1 hypothetical protein KCH_49350 [Kitasatospora cheerisanensis KCTC 2395]
MPKIRTPREQLERAMHVSFKVPEQAAAMLDAYRDQVLTEAHAIVLDVLPCLAGCDCAGQRAATALLAGRASQEG